jgi:transcriptional regulator GlxA family with amidase domain
MRRVLIAAFQGVALLDVAGSAEVFAAAGHRLGRKGYRVQFASIGGGACTTSATLRFETKDLLALRPRAGDTVVVAGGAEDAVLPALGDQALLAWIRGAAGRVERMTSVCSGAFLLAAAGILDGRRATTHWRGCERLAKMYPRVQVDPNAIFVADGDVWTSAGVATGIDMALGIVEADHGAAIADSIAAELVLYVRRPGFQSQFSEALVCQADHSNPLGRAVAWVRQNLREASVETLAKEAALSVRTLHRRCREQLGVTPATLIERARVEHARTLLATSAIAAKALAEQCGFGNPTNMKRAFERQLGMAPRDYRLLHARAA